MTALMAFASVTFAIVSLAINRVLPLLFLMLTIMFSLLAGGVQHPTTAKVAGWWGVVTSGEVLPTCVPFAHPVHKSSSTCAHGHIKIRLPNLHTPAALAFYAGTATLIRDMWGKDLLPQGFTKPFLAIEKVVLPRVEVPGHDAETGKAHRVRTGRAD